MGHWGFQPRFGGRGREGGGQLKAFGGRLKKGTGFFISHLKASAPLGKGDHSVGDQLKGKGFDGLSETHLRDIRCRLRVFAEKFNGQMVATISEKEIDDWLRARSLSTVQRQRFGQLVELAVKVVEFAGYAAFNVSMGGWAAPGGGKWANGHTVSASTRPVGVVSAAALAEFPVSGNEGVRRAALRGVAGSGMEFECGWKGVRSESSRKSPPR